MSFCFEVLWNVFGGSLKSFDKFWTYFFVSLNILF